MDHFYRHSPAETCPGCNPPFVPVEATEDNLKRVAADEVAAYVQESGRPGPDDIRHLVTRVWVQMKPGPGDWRAAIETEVLIAVANIK